MSPVDRISTLQAELAALKNQRKVKSSSDKLTGTWFSVKKRFPRKITRV